MRAARLCLWMASTAICCVGCSHKNSSLQQQAQAPPLQTGKGTLSPPAENQPQVKSDSPLASPLPQPPAQNVPLPPPTPKKVRRKAKPAPKPPDTTQVAAGPASQGAQPASTPPPVTERVAAGNGTGSGSPIGQLTTGDSATEERTKRETVDMIAATQQGLDGIKRNLSSEEKVTATQIRTFLKQAQQALDNGDTEGAHGLATKAKQLLDELTQP
jgi:hypothetical protein